MKLRLLVVRSVIGGLFIGHGAQKLFGWFGGRGPEATGQAFESMGMRPGRRNAVAAGAAETVGGALLLTGLFTPVAGAALSSVMITAIRRVHGGKGPWVTEGGYEYNLVMLAAIFALSEAGPGRISLDHELGTERCGTWWAIGQLAAGAAGSELMLRSARSAKGDAEAESTAAESRNGAESTVATPA